MLRGLPFSNHLLPWTCSGGLCARTRSACMALLNAVPRTGGEGPAEALWLVFRSPAAP